MTEDQADEMIGLLRLIFGELSAVRQDFAEFTNNGVQDMKATVEDITGQNRYNLGDLHSKLGDIEHSLSVIQINTSV